MSEKNEKTDESRACHDGRAADGTVHSWLACHSKIDDVEAAKKRDRRVFPASSTRVKRVTLGEEENRVPTGVRTERSFFAFARWLRPGVKGFM